MNKYSIAVSQNNQPLEFACGFEDAGIYINASFERMSDIANDLNYFAHRNGLRRVYIAVPVPFVCESHTANVTHS